ncbi:MAG TPA: (2Fe-2S)-binding protein [Methylophilaceae bacterium]|nr:(2Fe-2S)-binding protein [Methylophilaceae bacterium]
MCNAITERDIEHAIAHGATTMKALNRELGVGSQCGACARCTKECLAKARHKKIESFSNIFPINTQEAA